MIVDRKVAQGYSGIQDSAPFPSLSIYLDSAIYNIVDVEVKFCSYNIDQSKSRALYYKRTYKANTGISAPPVHSIVSSDYSLAESGDDLDLVITHTQSTGMLDFAIENSGATFPEIACNWWLEVKLFSN